MSSSNHGKLVVAIAGASGVLGSSVAPVFLSEENKPYFSRVLILSRPSATSKVQNLAKLGGEIVGVDFDSEENLTQKLAGVDVVINILPGHALAARDAVLKATVNVGAKVYFPSEFGIDYEKNNFPGYDSPEWIAKKAHKELAKKLTAGKVKVIFLLTAAFLEYVFVPPIGFDAKEELVTVVGSLDQPASFTSQTDIGRALARLSVLASFPESYPGVTVPEIVKIAGSTYTYNQIAKIFTAERKKHAGFKKGDGYQTKEIELKPYKEELKELVLKGEEKGLLKHLLVLLAEGNIDLSKDNDNALVNDGSWKWKTVEDFAKETQGVGTLFGIVKLD